MTAPRTAALRVISAHDARLGAGLRRAVSHAERARRHWLTYGVGDEPPTPTAVLWHLVRRHAPHLEDDARTAARWAGRPYTDRGRHRQAMCLLGTLYPRLDTDIRRYGADGPRTVATRRSILHEEDSLMESLPMVLTDALSLPEDAMVLSHAGQLVLVAAARPDADTVTLRRRALPTPCSVQQIIEIAAELGYRAILPSSEQQRVIEQLLARQAADADLLVAARETIDELRITVAQTAAHRDLLAQELEQLRNTPPPPAATAAPQGDVDDESLPTLPDELTASTDLSAFVHPRVRKQAAAAQPAPLDGRTTPWTCPDCGFEGKRGGRGVHRRHCSGRESAAKPETEADRRRAA